MYQVFSVTTRYTKKFHTYILTFSFKLERFTARKTVEHIYQPFKSYSILNRVNRKAFDDFHKIAKTLHAICACII
jgi:hypothetical protein